MHMISDPKITWYEGCKITRRSRDFWIITRL